MTTTTEELVKDIELNYPVPEDLTQILIDYADRNNELASTFMNEFKFYGKSLDEWSSITSIKLPSYSEISPEKFRDLCIRCANAYQQASYFYSVCNSMHSGLDSGSHTKKADIVRALVDHYSKSKGKRPAANTIDNIAESFLKETTNGKTAAKILKDFWRDKKETLLEVRKALEMIGFSINMEIKYHPGDE